MSKKRGSTTLNSFDLTLISSSMGVKIKEWSQAQFGY